jgi:ABC-type branched-subunit amino acid transport system substrate-binding protein/serine/threonine protein kinase
MYDEFLYRAIQPLEPYTEKSNGKRHDTQLYEVTEPEGNQSILKVLVNNGSRARALFDREAQILQQLTHLGIPKFERSFTVLTSAGNTLRCLVMEKIEGQNLAQWLEQHNTLSETTALKWLKQLTEILAIVHRHRFLHQDIKPSNIMRQPDDQLVLVDFSNVPGIVSAGYTPPEQAEAKAVPQSDFFALGRTFVHLLTGRHPIDLPKNSQTRTLIWRSHAPQITEPLADLIDNLMAPLPQNRPQTEQEILNRISEISHLSNKLEKPSKPKNQHLVTFKKISHDRWIIGAAILSGWIVASGVASTKLLFPTSNPTASSTVEPSLVANSQPICESISTDPRLSCGEKTLFPDSLIPQKQQGIEAFKKGNYKEAAELFKQARQQDPSDAETVIYQQNSELAGQNMEPYTIAIALPAKFSPQPGENMSVLRGVAQAQEQVNRQKIDSRGLRVLIVNDENDAEKAQQAVEKLVKETALLGVIGHYTSEVTQSVLPIYRKHNLVLVSYGSTATELSQKSPRNDHVFFRTIPSHELGGQALIFYLINQSRQQKLVVFYTPKSVYSNSFYQNVVNNVKIAQTSGIDIQIIESIDLCRSDFNAEQVLAQASQQGATTIALFPDSQACVELSYGNRISILRANAKANSKPIVASWTLGRRDTLETAGEFTAGKLVISAPWNVLKHLSDKPNSEFVRQSKQLWGESELWNEGVNGLTAFSYDATYVLITALEKLAQKKIQPSRIVVQQELANPNFQATGVTGTIRFSGSDRREPMNVLLKVVPSKNCNQYGYSFVPVNYFVTKDEMLDCRSL